MRSISAKVVRSSPDRTRIDPVDPISNPDRPEIDPAAVIQYAKWNHQVLHRKPNAAKHKQLHRNVGFCDPIADPEQFLQIIAMLFINCDARCHGNPQPFWLKY